MGAATVSIDDLGALVLVLDAENKVVQHNRALEVFTGRPSEETQGHLLREIFDPEAVEPLLRALTVARTGAAARAETTLRAGAGARRTVAWSCRLLREPRVPVGCVVATGIDGAELGEAWPRRAQEYFEKAIAVAPDALVAVDAKQRIVFYNDGAHRIFGWSKEEVVGEPLEMLIPERMRASHRRHVDAFASGPETTRRIAEGRSPIVGLRKSGEEFMAAATISRGEIGEQRIMSAMLVDLSEQNRANKALHLAEERLRLALAASPAVVFNQDRDLRYTWIHNPREPFAEEQVLGRTDFDLLPQDDAESLTSLKRRVLETGRPAREIVPTTIAGATLYYDLTVEPVLGESGLIAGITCATWDVTEQKRTEDEQRFIAEVGAALMAAAPDAEATLRVLAQLCVREIADWTIVDLVAAGGVRRLAVAHAEAAKAPVARALEQLPLDRTRAHLVSEPLSGRTKLVTEVTPAYLESVAQSSEHLALLHALDARSLIAVPLIFAGVVIGAFGLISSRASRAYDARDAQLAEQLAHVAALAIENARLHQSRARAVAAREEVLGVVAHDLRSPLGVVLMASEMLRRDAPATERRDSRTAETISRAALRMSRLVQDLLDVTQLDSGTLAIRRDRVPAELLVREAIEAQSAVATAASLELRAEITSPLPEVDGDRDRLLQALDNLAGNAIKFTPPQGRVTIGASLRGDDVLFWISDTGSGIAPEALPRVFDRFWQAQKDRRGAGLGLSIVKGIVEAHGGKVWAESRLGSGSTFFFTVPVARSVGAGPPAPPVEGGVGPSPPA
jgi:PAS domain S-box-containing protein